MAEATTTAKVDHPFPEYLLANLQEALPEGYAPEYYNNIEYILRVIATEKDYRSQLAVLRKAIHNGEYQKLGELGKALETGFNKREDGGLFWKWSKVVSVRHQESLEIDIVLLGRLAKAIGDAPIFMMWLDENFADKCEYLFMHFIFRQPMYYKLFPRHYKGEYPGMVGEHFSLFEQYSKKFKEGLGDYVPESFFYKSNVKPPYEFIDQDHEDKFFKTPVAVADYHPEAQDNEDDSLDEDMSKLEVEDEETTAAYKELMDSETTRPFAVRMLKVIHAMEKEKEGKPK